MLFYCWLNRELTHNKNMLELNSIAILTLCTYKIDSSEFKFSFKFLVCFPLSCNFNIINKTHSQIKLTSLLSFWYVLEKLIFCKSTNG